MLKDNFQFLDSQIFCNKDKPRTFQIDTQLNFSKDFSHGMSIQKRKQFIYMQREFLYNFESKEYSSIESSILQYLSNLKKHEKAPKKDLD